MVSKQRTTRQFLAETGKHLAWMMGVAMVIIIAMTVLHASHHYPTEDGTGWDCMNQGNHVCGPDSGQPAGCYSNGILVIPWTNYTEPTLDPLYAQVTPPC